MEGDAGAASLRGGRGRGRGRGTGTGPAASSSPELTPQNPITAPSAAPVPIPVPGPPRARPLPPAALSNTQSAPSFSAESSSPAVASAPVPAPIPVPGPKTGVRPPPPGGSGGVPIPAPISVPGPTRGGSLRGTGRHSSYTPPAESPAAETPSDALPATATVSGPGPSALGGAPVPGERRAMSGYQNESPLQPAAGSSSPSPVKFPPPPVTGLAKPPAASPPGAPPRFRGAPPAPARSPLQEAPAVTSSEEAAPAEEPATEEENGADANGSEDGEKPSWQGASSRRVRSAVPGAFGAISPKGEPLSAARVAAPPPPASTGAIPVPSAVPKSLTPQPGRRIGSIGVPGGVNFGSLPAESKLAALASAEAEDAQRPSPAKREAIQRSTSSGAIAAAPLLKPRSSGVVTAPPDSAESASSPESSPLASPGAVPAPKIVEPKKPRKVDPNAPAPPPREPEIVGLRKAEDLPELPPRNIANKVASAAPTTTKKTREELRQNCLNEIYETEKGYVEDLETIINVFILPLRLKQAVTESILKNIFSNVEVLVSFNKELLALLEVRIKDTSGIDVQVGDIFVKMGDYLKAYKVYCSNQATSLSTLEFQTKKNAQFKSTIDIAHNDAHCKGMFLSFFLIKPIQRVCKYPLLLRELIRYTPEEHSDFDPLNKAYEKINEVVSDINEATRVSEGLTRTLELQRCIDGLEIELVSPNRRLVRENEITFHKNAKTKHGEKRYIFLFTDLIILATKKGNNKYDHKFHVELGHAKLTVLADTPYIKYAFEVTPLQKKQKCILSCETDNEQREWVKIIKKLIKDFQLREVQEKKRNKLAGE